MTSPQLPALKPTCHVCGAALTRFRRYCAICPDCYRIQCAICHQPIYRDQGFCATRQGRYQHLACSGQPISFSLQPPAP